MAGGRAQVPFVFHSSRSEVIGLRAGALLIHSFIHSFDTGYAPGTVVGTENAALNKADGNPCLQKD